MRLRDEVRIYSRCEEGELEREIFEFSCAVRT